MKTRFFKSQLLAVTALVTMLFVSCSDSKEPLSMIPKETRMVITAKPVDLVQKVNLEELDLPEDAQEFKDLLSENSGIDPKQVVFFEYDKQAWLSLLINDKDNFKKTINSSSLNLSGPEKLTGYEDFEVYSGNNGILIAKGGNAWFCMSMNSDDQKKAARDVNKFLELEESESVLGNPEIVENLSNGDICAYFNIKSFAELTARDINAMYRQFGINPDNVPFVKKFMDSNLFLSAEFLKDDMKFTARILSQEGENLLPSLNLSNLNPSILNFLNEKSSFVVASSLSKEWIDMIQKIIMGSSANDPMAAVLANTFLSNIQGSVAFGMTFDNLDMPMYNPMSLAIEMKPGAGKMIADLVYKQLVPMQAVIANGDGTFSIPVDENLTLLAGVKDDFLYVSTTALPSSTFANSQYAEKFKGVNAAILFDVPGNSALAAKASEELGMSFAGGNVYAYSDNEKIEYVFHVNENQEENILAYFVKLIQSAMEKQRQSYYY